MKSTLVKLTSDKPSCAGFDDEYLYISTSLDHETLDELKNAARGNRSGRKGYIVFELKSFWELTCHQKMEYFFFRYKVKGKQKKYLLQISDRENRIAFCESLAKASGLGTKTESDNPYSRVQVNLIPIIMITYFTVGFCLCASDIVPEPGPRSRSRLMSDAVKAVGPTAFFIIGSVLIGFFLFRLVRNIKQSDTRIVYSF